MIGQFSHGFFFLALNTQWNCRVLWAGSAVSFILARKLDPSLSRLGSSSLSVKLEGDTPLSPRVTPTTWQGTLNLIGSWNHYKKCVFLPRAVIDFFSCNMALRRSRRLQGLAPEQPRLEQVCFICQRELDIGSLTRCQRTSCCQVFMHRSCHRQMVTTLPTCGNCRRGKEMNDHMDEYEEVSVSKDNEVWPWKIQLDFLGHTLFTLFFH